ncbi:hypothetical protein OVY29_18240 [Sphingopyxis sp. SE2]|jgi:hypothetical protein|uniref:hypothetical protein n=1 Tax=unclassified Sphingopyxis TaxID=2614943 RepID=UPI00050E6983|nr:MULTISPECIES: hypothetical protein [unclassified Sphingopyxis]KGB59226.1 hypothetical protein FG95_00134 [Sphingopyxis sp. LC363]MDT7530604.1 hypothetical protein [Sphingopyxis sp. SE2]
MMMTGGSLWPIIATLAAQGAPGADVAPPPPAPEEPPVAENAAPAERPAEELIPPPPPVDWQDRIKDDLVTEIIEGRRRPGYRPDLPDALSQDNVGALRPPPPQAFPGMEDQLPIPDRWRLIETLGVVKERWFDPYNQNTYKGDRPIDRSKVKWLPIKGDDWFIVANAVSDTVFEPRTFPIPVGVQTTERPGSLDVFGKDRSFVFAQTFIAGAALIKGSTAFKPPDIEYRVTLAYQANYVDVPERRVLDVRPSKASHRYDSFLGLQELFVDKHLGNTSDRYDFYSVRLGIQPFQSDFRGFLFNDSQLGIRLFGNRDNNRFQYNLAAFWRLEKDTNSGLNDITQTPRDDFVLTANLYRQDFPVVGLTSQISVTYNMNREKNDVQIDHNGFPVRPALLGDLRGREYDVVYLGYSADGRIGRINLTASFYAALGEDRNSFFTSKPAEIRAGFGAVELSYDHDWMRFRLSGLYATGDGDPYNRTEGGFDAIFENPIFGGADTSYWIRQTIPFAGGGRVIAINGRNGILNSLRSSKEEGQSNFNNPGTVFVGAGADFDLTPEFRVSTNFNHLWFENTLSLQALRVEGSIPKDIGFDLSVAAIWRPKATQNIVGRLSAAVLLPGKGFKDLFDNKQKNDAYVSILANVILSF